MYEEYEYQELKWKDSLFIWTMLTLCLAVWGLTVAIIVRYHAEIWACLTGGLGL